LGLIGPDDNPQTEGQATQRHAERQAAQAARRNRVDDELAKRSEYGEEWNDGLRERDDDRGRYEEHHTDRSAHLQGAKAGHGQHERQQDA
jgi:hypothetical protein